MTKKGIIIVESEMEEVSYQTTTTMEYTPCMVVEGESGYNVLDYHWGEDRAIAEKLAEDYNKKLGITQEEVEDLKFHSMFPEAI